MRTLTSKVWIPENTGGEVADSKGDDWVIMRSEASSPGTQPTYTTAPLGILQSAASVILVGLVGGSVYMMEESRIKSF